MQPKAEMVHWMFATGVLMVGLCLLAEAIVGREVWRRRAWRAYIWPGLALVVLRRRLRVDVRDRRRAPLLRPRSRADLRPPLTGGGSPAPVKRVVAPLALVAFLAVPAAAFAHATLTQTTPSFRQRLARS